MPLIRSLSLIGNVDEYVLPRSAMICAAPLQLPMLVRPPPCRPVERHAVASLQLAARRSADLLKVTVNKQLKHHMRVFSF